MPDVSIMIELCDILSINVNELLSGERLSEENYREKANENIVSMIKVADENRKTKNKIILFKKLAKGCQYKANLESGKVFYGKNKNI